MNKEYIPETSAGGSGSYYPKQQDGKALFPSIDFLSYKE
jgi:hypothetical protein